MNTFGLLAILASVLTAVIAAPQSTNGINSKVRKNPVLSLKQLLPLRHKINNIKAKSSNPLDLDFAELSTAMEGAVMLSWLALIDSQKSLDALLGQYGDLLSQIASANEEAGGLMTTSYYRFVLLAGGLVDEEEIPALAQETVDSFLSAAESLSLETESLVYKTAPEFVPQVKEIDRKIISDINAAIERILFILRNAKH